MKLLDSEVTVMENEVKTNTGIEEKSTTVVDENKGKGDAQFTQEQVNNIVRDRLERERNSIYGAYGVKTREELDALAKKGQDYDNVKGEYDKTLSEKKDIFEKYVFLTNNISPEKQDDVKAYFKGKELDFTDETLKKELETHPEWLGKAEKVTTITQVGVEGGKEKEKPSEKDLASQMFGVKLI